jgi:hypothetical protein
MVDPAPNAAWAAATGCDIDAARAEQGLASVREIQRVTASWPVRRRRPPWPAAPAPASARDAGAAATGAARALG